MQMSFVGPTLRRTLWVLVAMAFGLSGPAYAQEPYPEEEPDPELQAEEMPADEPQAADAAEEEQLPADEVVDEEPVADEAMDEGSAHEETQVADAADDDNWWVDVPFDESDDAIPTDPALDPTGLGWEAVEYANDGDGIEDVPVLLPDGIWKAREMPVVRPRAGPPGAAKPPGTAQPPGSAQPPKSGRPAEGEGKDTPYSFGGKPVSDAGVPWQAQIYYPKSIPEWDEDLRKGKPLWQMQHQCGGVLIAADWVLTAAHCVNQHMVDVGYRVRLGQENIAQEGGMNFKIDRIVMHSKYGDKTYPEPPPNMYANDITLVHIVEEGPPRPRDLRQIRPVRLYEGPPPKAGTQVTGTGWGKTLTVKSNAPNAILLKVDLQVMDNETCRNRKGYGPERVGDKVVCAARKGQSTCRGDSGGPLTFTNDGLLVGIVSWGKEDCTGDGQPSVFTSIVAYSDWIKQAMALDPKKNSLP